MLFCCSVSFVGKIQCDLDQWSQPNFGQWFLRSSLLYCASFISSRQDGVIEKTPTLVFYLIIKLSQVLLWPPSAPFDCNNKCLWKKETLIFQCFCHLISLLMNGPQGAFWHLRSKARKTPFLLANIYTAPSLPFSKRSRTKFSQNAMQSKCSQNAAKMQSKCS